MALGGRTKFSLVSVGAGVRAGDELICQRCCAVRVDEDTTSIPELVYPTLDSSRQAELAILKDVSERETKLVRHALTFGSQMNHGSLRLKKCGLFR